MTNDEKMREELEACVNHSLHNVDLLIEDKPLFLALDAARENVAAAFTDIRNAAFGVIESRNTKGTHKSTLRREEEALTRAEGK